MKKWYLGHLKGQMKVCLPGDVKGEGKGLLS